MKLVYLSTARIPDDWAHVIQIMKMCEAFVGAGCEVRLLVPRRAKTSADDPFLFAGVKNNFRITRLPCIDLFPGTQSRVWYAVRNYSFFFLARIYLLFSTFDVVYTRELLAWTPVRKTVFEFHTVTPSLIRRLSSLEMSRGIVAITDGIRVALGKYSLAAARILVAPDGVDLDDFSKPESKESSRERLGLAPDSLVAMYIGRIDTWKGTDALFAAAAQLTPAIQTVVIGEGEDALSVLQQNYPAVTFLGPRPYRELANNQSSADVLVLPNSGKSDISAKYTSPLKLFAYMTSGRPIVASDLPSLREVLSEKNAFFVEPDNAEALAEGVRYALSHPEEAKARASRAREDVKGYTWESRAKRIVTFINTGSSAQITPGVQSCE